ncbi:hypothetical protein HanPSC8_Chr09g0372001 [Helianthus annuus]|nr:hypothetical protein HanPSC8_Chr09g0372001 [Helianthus annuus]
MCEHKNSTKSIINSIYLVLFQSLSRITVSFVLLDYLPSLLVRYFREFLYATNVDY